MITVRQAVEREAIEACVVLRRSIEELCVADHRGDAGVLQWWLANKTLENVLAWIRAPGQYLIIAEEDGRMLGVGLARAGGGIELNYVLPEARFQGISRAMLRALEEYLRDHGSAVSRLTSTGTAHRFYRAAGYEDDGPPSTAGGMTGHPMVKRL